MNPKPKIFDSSLDRIELYSLWMLAACQNHDARYREEMRALCEKKDSH